MVAGKMKSPAAHTSAARHGTDRPGLRRQIIRDAERSVMQNPRAARAARELERRRKGAETRCQSVSIKSGSWRLEAGSWTHGGEILRLTRRGGQAMFAIPSTSLKASRIRIVDGCETCRDISAVLLMGLELRGKYRGMGVAIFSAMAPLGRRACGPAICTD